MLEELLQYVQANHRMCPMPQRWNELWEMLPDRKRVGNGWEPALPLILAAWWETPALLKILRLREHIEYAAQNGVLRQVDQYLRNLPEAEWAHIGDFSDKRGRDAGTINQPRDEGGVDFNFAFVDFDSPPEVTQEADTKDSHLESDEPWTISIGGLKNPAHKASGVDYASQWPKELEIIHQHGPFTSDELQGLSLEQITDYYYVTSWVLREEGEKGFVAVRAELRQLLLNRLQRGERLRAE